MADLHDLHPVLAVSLDRRGGDVAVRRVARTGAPVVALVERGASVPAGVSERVDVGVNRARVGRAVREATSRNATWVAVPRGMGTADYLLSAAVRSVGAEVDAHHPGIALLVVSGDPDEVGDYRRALVVVDPAGPAASGMGALAAVELAVCTGADLDVLVLGLDADASLGSTDEALHYLPVGRSNDLLHRALGLAEEHDLHTRWMAGGRGDPIDIVSRVLGEGDYDVAVDDLGGHRLRKRIGKRHDIRRLLDDPSSGAVPRWLLTDTTCDVLVVVDAISLGMVPVAAARTGMAAAMALGVVGLAAPAAALVTTSGQAGSSVSASAVTSLDEQPGPTLEIPPVQRPVTLPADARPEAVVDDGEAEAQPAQAAESEPDQATPIRAAELSQAHEAARAADLEAQEAAKRTEAAAQQADAAAAEAQAARDVLLEAKVRAFPAASQLAGARVEMGEAERERDEAEAERARAERLHNPVTSVVTSGATEASLDSAERVVAEADAVAEVAQSQAAQAYEEYQRFADEIEAATAELTAADNAAQAAAATQEQHAEVAAAATATAEDLATAAGELDQAFVDQGLHPPAQGGVTSAFGPRVHPITGAHKAHTGTDFEGADGQYYAAADGVVTYAGYDGAYGYTVHVDHGVVAGKHMQTWYAHQPGLSVEVGQSVERGQVIGQIGSSGYSTGPHAHVELRLDGEPVDPMPFIR